MADYAHEQTDLMIARLENELRREYGRAARETQKKLDDYLKAFEKKDKERKAQVERGELTEEEYKRWRKGQILMGERWRAMQKTLAEDMHNVNDIAMSIVRGHLPEVYALNHNFATFEVETKSMIDTSYVLYDHQTVERLFRENPQLLPEPSPTSKTGKLLAANKDLRWNRQRIQSELLQGILQGEAITTIARRMQNVTNSNYKAAVRNARTMYPPAQNAGRNDAYIRASKMGIDLDVTWLATLDNRTRHSHRQLDRQTRDVNEAFEVDGVKIRYPGDMGAGEYKVPPSLLYNCRCTLVANVKGYALDFSRRSLKALNGKAYEEWKQGHYERERKNGKKRSKDNADQ